MLGLMVKRGRDEYGLEESFSMPLVALRLEPVSLLLLRRSRAVMRLLKGLEG